LRKHSCTLIIYRRIKETIFSHRHDIAVRFWQKVLFRCFVEKAYYSWPSRSRSISSSNW